MFPLPTRVDPSLRQDLPQPTSPPPPPRAVQPPQPRRRRRSLARREPSQSVPALRARQTITDQDQLPAAMQLCETGSANDVVTCFPTADDVFPQHQWASLVWNSNLPQFAQFNKLDIFLFRADNMEQILSFPNTQNPSQRAGTLPAPGAQVNDTWFGTEGLNWSGQNTTFHYFWVIVPTGEPASGGFPQPTFAAVQTTFADSVASSMSSASSASSLASVSRASASASASAASASLTAHPSGAASGVPTGSGTPSSGPGSGSGSIQSDHSSSFPHWAIAVIVILGFAAILATGIVLFLLCRRMNRRRRNGSARGSMGSASPMIAQRNGEVKDTGPATIATSPTEAGEQPVTEKTAFLPRPTSSVPGDGASEASRSQSDGAPFSGADAAIMANAFRAALRRPDFAGRPVEEGESPESGNNSGDKELAAGAGEEDEPDRRDLGRELADEGRDIRSVASSRGVKIDNTSESGDTVRDREDPR